VATIVERTYPRQPDPEAVNKLAQVILKIGLRILNDAAKKSLDSENVGHVERR